jgi:hypothetical protein
MTIGETLRARFSMWLLLTLMLAVITAPDTFDTPPPGL